MVSDYNDDALYAKKKLQEVSDTHCLAKWFQTSLHLTTGHTNSCYHNPPHKIDESTLYQPHMLLHTNQRLDEKVQMLGGERTKGCEYCWKLEDQGNLSDRHYRSGEPWAMDNFDKASMSSLLSSAGHDDPTYVEVNFNSACNLKCMYCSPQYSTTWMAHAKQHGPYPTLEPHNDPVHFEGDRRPIPRREHNPYVEAFWKRFPHLYKNLRHLRLTGGEPLMDDNTYKVFEYILEHPKPDLHLNVTSNFSVEHELFHEYLEYSKRICDGENVEHMMQFVSLDGFGRKAEYMRQGMDFNRVWDYVNEFLYRIPGRNSVTFIITMNALSISSLDTLLTAINGLREIYSNDYQRVWFDVPLLRDPAWMSIQNLPESYQWKLQQIINWMTGKDEYSCEGFSGFKDYEIDKVRRDLDFMKTELTEEKLTKNKVNFHRFYAEYDKRHGTDFLEVFPEMEDYWAECMYRSKTYE